MSCNKANKFLISIVWITCKNNIAIRKVFPCIGSFHHTPNLDLEEIKSWWSLINDLFCIDCNLDDPQVYHLAFCKCCMEGLFSIKRMYYKITIASLSSPPICFHICKTHWLENFYLSLAFFKEKCKCNY